MLDRIYAITNPSTNLAYVGRTQRTLLDRWAEHLNDGADHRSHKRLAEALKHDPDGFTITELECSETASEREWYDAFVADGWTMLNDAPPNRRQPKQRNAAAERAWRRANDDADQRLNARDGSGVEAHAMLARLTGKAAWERFANAHPEYVQALRSDRLRPSLLRRS